MNEKKSVSNECYQEAYNNKDNQNIIKSVYKRYSKDLDYETLKSCGLHALWRALQFHNGASYTTAFTSSLWKFTNWECSKKIKEIRLKNNSKRKIKLKTVEDYDILDSKYISYNKPLKLNNFEFIKKYLDEEQFEILSMKYLYNNTNKEIAEKLNCCPKVLKKKLYRALSILKTEMVYNELSG